MAGRPENVFKTAFHTCPGFAIHDYTTRDIRHYAEDRIGKEHFGTLTDDDIVATAPLVEEIIRKANGVFLWVTLVVNELVEGLCEGDTIMELEHLLSQIPQELEDLYTRAVRRVPRTSSSALEKHRYEAYVMFQIAIHAQGPLSVPQFTKMVLYSTFGESSVDDAAQALSQNKLERRLNSKSAGLLEAVSVSNGGVGLDCVQFIHQTTKEYMSSSSGQSLLREHLGIKPLASGTLFILRYLISQIASEKPSKEELVSEDFPDYARTLEKREHIPVGRFLEPVIKSREHFKDILHSAGLLSTVDQLGCYTSCPISQEISFVLFYLFLKLPLSLERYIANHRDCIDENLWYPLFRCVFAYTVILDEDVVQVLLDANVDAEISEDDFQRLMEFAHVESLREYVPPRKTRKTRIQALCAELQERRNTRCRYA